MAKVRSCQCPSKGAISAQQQCVTGLPTESQGMELLMQPKTVLLLGFVVLMGLNNAHADIGPKPTVNFSIVANSEALVTDGILLVCERNNCSDAKPLSVIGPQRFGCGDRSCWGLAYGFSPYLQLRLTLSDGRSLTSQAFKKEAFEAFFVATITGNVLEVLEISEPVSQPIAPSQ